jgi:hypothetical protein
MGETAAGNGTAADRQIGSPAIRDKCFDPAPEEGAVSWVERPGFFSFGAAGASPKWEPSAPRAISPWN